MIVGPAWLPALGGSSAAARNLLLFGQQVPHRDGRIEAQVGRDGKLNSYGIICENDAFETQATEERRKAS